MKLTPILIASITTITFTSCKRELRQDFFPDETKTGANTFGCYIDNNLFEPCQKWTRTPLTRVGAWGQVDEHDSGSIQITASNTCDSKKGQLISIWLDSVKIVANTTYKFGNVSCFCPGNVSCTFDQDYNTFYSDSTLNGSLTITFVDKVKKIVSGNFEVELKKSWVDTVRLTKGRFDVTYH